MKALKFITLFIVGFAFTNCTHTRGTDSKTSTETIKIKPAELSLYERLGGAEGISLIVDDIIAAHMANPVISSKFAHLKDNPEHLAVFQEHVKEFLGAGTGGSEKYTGQDMPTAHKGLQTTPKEFLKLIGEI